MKCIQEADAQQPVAVLIFRNIFGAPVEIFELVTYSVSLEAAIYPKY